MGVEAKIDIRDAVAVFRYYGAATKKDGVDVLNKFAKDVAYRSAHFTPKATAARIRSGLFADPHLRYALTALALKRRGIGALPSPEFQKAVDKFVARRMSSASYLRAAFAEAVQRLGGSFRGAKFKGASGFANKATITRLVAEIVGIVNQPNESHARSAEAILIKAVNAAIKDKLEDMRNYATELLAKRARGVSG